MNRPGPGLLPHLLKSLLLCFLVVWLLAAGTAGAAPAADVRPAEANTGFALADAGGNIVWAVNEDTPLVPASVLKIATSLAALDRLGEDFRFETRFYLDAENRRLFIKGFGDPLFVSEKIDKVCARLAEKLDQKGIAALDALRVDQSFFVNDIAIPGSGDSLNPYDVCQAALSANFNTVFFERDAHTGRYVSAEKQTPLLPVFREKIAAIGLEKGRIALSREESLVYPGRLVACFLEKHGIAVPAEVGQGPVPSSTAPFFVYTSDFSMKTVIQKLLKYSSNFMANQVLLTMGAAVHGPPATLEKGADVLRRFLRETIGVHKAQIKEGSGISRRNRLSCRDMIAVLHAFRPYHGLLQTDGNGFYKTGTLSGIRTRAGYLKAPDGSLRPYVIMVNAPGRGYHAILKQMAARTE